MKTEIRSKYKEQVSILKALAHESRLAIIERLAQKPCTVGELVQMIGDEQSTVSKHLTVLRFAKIVEDERNGKNVIYSLAMPCVVNFLSCAINLPIDQTAE